MLTIPAGGLAAPPRLDAAREVFAHREPTLYAAGATRAWSTNLGLRLTTQIRSYHLLDEYLYAIGSDGAVRSIRADTGEFVWTREVTRPGAKPWRPTAYESLGVRAAVFTRLDDVVFLDPATGFQVGSPEDEREGPEVEPLGPVRLQSSPIAPVAVSPSSVFAAAPGRRLHCYNIEDNLATWWRDWPDLLETAPVYVGQQNMVVAADRSGTLIGLGSGGGEQLFKTTLVGRPVGWITVNGDSVYVATDAVRLYEVGLADGAVTLEYRLPGLPEGGPVVAGQSVYQAIAEGGVQRVGRELEWRNWFIPDAKGFLAMWGDRALLSARDGGWLVVEGPSGEVVGRVSLPPELAGIPNPRTEAVLMGTPRGEVRCYRPVGAPPLTAEAFRAKPATAAQPAETGEEEAAEPVADAGSEEEKGEEEASEAEDTSSAAQPDRSEMTPEEKLLADPLRSD
jgi:hypothetical protein